MGSDEAALLACIDVSTASLDAGLLSFCPPCLPLGQNQAGSFPGNPNEAWILLSGKHALAFYSVSLQSFSFSRSQESAVGERKRLLQRLEKKTWCWFFGVKMLTGHCFSLSSVSLWLSRPSCWSMKYSLTVSHQWIFIYNWYCSDHEDNIVIKAW